MIEMQNTRITEVILQVIIFKGMQGSMRCLRVTLCDPV